MKDTLIKFTDEYIKSHNNQTFVKLLFSKPTSKNNIEKISARYVVIKQQKMLSFVYTYPTKTITKNFSIEESVKVLDELLNNEFKNLILYTKKEDVRLSFNKKMEPKLDYLKPAFADSIPMMHDKEKNRLIEASDNLYLKELGIVSENNMPIKSMQDKFVQINKFIETIDVVVKESFLNEKKDKVHIVDMGSGKGYLTFAVYDYLCNKLKLDVHIEGVEMREELVHLCNDIAAKCGFKNLKFYKGDIKAYQTDTIDMLIALHACDTATDDAIFQGIRAGSSVIITAPCCHKQIRKAFNVDNILSEVTKHGILKERQAEIVTDTLRGMVLELYGYKTQIFEFIADAHTHKNVLIVGVKNNKKPKPDLQIRINNLKALFGIKSFYLETLFSVRP